MTQTRIPVLPTSPEQIGVLVAAFVRGIAASLYEVVA